eukprot:c16647_g1_i1 orf=96-584(-)
MASVQVSEEVYEVLLRAGEKAPTPTCFPTEKSTTLISAKVSVDIDLEKLAQEVQKALNEIRAGLGTNQDLGKVTRDIVHHFLNAYPTFNVMVVHPPHIATFHDSVMKEISVPYNYVLSRLYKVYVFKKGTFTLLADGGYENWCFGGNFKREGKYVTFEERTY